MTGRLRQPPRWHMCKGPNPRPGRKQAVFSYLARPWGQGNMNRIRPLVVYPDREADAKFLRVYPETGRHAPVSRRQALNGASPRYNWTYSRHDVAWNDLEQYLHRRFPGETFKREGCQVSLRCDLSLSLSINDRTTNMSRSVSHGGYGLSMLRNLKHIRI